MAAHISLVKSGNVLQQPIHETENEKLNENFVAFKNGIYKTISTLLKIQAMLFFFFYTLCFFILTIFAVIFLSFVYMLDESTE